MTLINRINKEVSELRLQHPNHEIFPILDRCNPPWGSGGYYLALDRLGFVTGIMPGFNLYYCMDTGEEEAYAAMLIFKPTNIAGRAEEEIELKEFSAGEQGYIDSCVYATLLQLEELMRIPGLNERIQARIRK